LFGKILKKLRDDAGISQQRLADIVGLTQQAVAKWESSKAEPDLATVAKLAEYFQVSTDYILGKTNIRAPIETIDDELNAIMRDLGPDVTLHFYDLKDMTKEEKENLKIFLQGLKARREQKNKE
jgi:transcriptional regulator with XRE-family HTH domain